MHFSKGITSLSVAAFASYHGVVDALRPKEEANADAGILSPRDDMTAAAHHANGVRGGGSMTALDRSNGVLQSVSQVCTAGYLDCHGDCKSTCQGQCCVGTSACLGFTGRICKDGSCNGDYACFRESRYGNIPDR